MCGPDNRCRGTEKNEEKPSMKRKTFLTLKNETYLENDCFEKNKLNFKRVHYIASVLVDFTGVILHGHLAQFKSKKSRLQLFISKKDF